MVTDGGGPEGGSGATSEMYSAGTMVSELSITGLASTTPSPSSEADGP